MPTPSLVLVILEVLESQVHTSPVNSPEKMCSFRFTKQLLLQRDSKTPHHPCHGNGEATKSLNVLLILMETSCWPRSAQQVDAILIPSRIPSSKMKTILVL
jgi:hypothetical protein